MNRHAVLEQIDREQYPEAYLYLNSTQCGNETPFSIVANLVECDKPKVFPPVLVGYITAMYEAEIADGNHHAMNNLGALYYGGDRGFEQSFEKAVKLYKQAAERGNQVAQENLGYCYYYGRDMDVDYEKAFQYFALGAFNGYPVSLYKIGDMYRKGLYVAKNPFEAFLLYNRALREATDDDSKRISGPVHLRLGEMCLTGEGTDKDPQQALLHFNLAEIMLLQMVMDGDMMYRKSLEEAIKGQKKARKMIELPPDEALADTGIAVA